MNPQNRSQLAADFGASGLGPVRGLSTLAFGPNKGQNRFLAIKGVAGTWVLLPPLSNLSYTIELPGRSSFILGVQAGSPFTQNRLVWKKGGEAPHLFHWVLR